MGKPRGRPRGAITPTVEDKIIEALGNSANMEQAAAFAGIGLSTLHRHRYADKTFEQRCIVARDLSKYRLVEQIADKGKAKDGPWQALAWILERRYPNEYGRRDPDAISRKELKALINQLTATLITRLPMEFHADLFKGIGEMLMGVIGDKEQEKPSE